MSPGCVLVEKRSVLRGCAALMAFVLLALLCLATNPPARSQYTTTTSGLRPAVSIPRVDPLGRNFPDLHGTPFHPALPRSAAITPAVPLPPPAAAASIWSTWAHPGLTGLLAGLTVAAWSWRWRRSGFYGEQPPMAMATVPGAVARPPEDFGGDPALCAAGRVLEEAFRASAPGAPGVWPGGEEGVWRAAERWLAAAEVREVQAFAAAVDCGGPVTSVSELACQVAAQLHCRSAALWTDPKRTGRMLALGRPATALRSAPEKAPLDAQAEGKWGAAGIDDAAERLESAKAAAVAAVAGSVAYGGPGLLATGLGPQWELDTDFAALSCALFGVVYRYATRTDPNPNLKQGVVGGFAIVRLLAKVQASPTCTPFPLSCGPPLGYLDWAMVWQAVGAGVASFAAFGGAAIALEEAMNRRWVRRFGEAATTPKPVPDDGDLSAKQ